MENLNEAHGEYIESVHNPADKILDWNSALRYLSDGNKRFRDNNTITRDTNVFDRSVLKDGQNPFAVIVTCSDSRVVPEIIFDQKLGDIFVIRNAGNIADSSTLGSIEYAVEHLKTPLIVVVGHSHCGAVTGAVKGGEYPKNLQASINAINAVIVNRDDLDAAIRENINGVVAIISSNELVRELGTKVTGAFYDIETGEVDFL